MLTEIIELLENKKIFERERKTNEIRALGILLVYSGLSCRKAGDILGYFDRASYEAVRMWYHRTWQKISLPAPAEREEQ